MTGEFINAIFDCTVPGIEIYIDESCSVSIEDYMSVQKDANGAILKTKVKNKTTLQTYEEHGHLSDTFRYVVVDLCSEQYIEFSNRRKRNLYACNGTINFFNPDTECKYTKKILYVTLTNGSFDAVARANLNAEQLIIYNALNTTYGNRNYLWDVNNVTSGSGGNGMSYEIPPEALQDEEFARMIREAEKYLGVPYVWGGYSPSGFDCSGFVSYVINHCGNGWNYGRLTADGLRGVCTYVSPEEAKPGDLIFFQGTYNTSGASHVGIYVGNNMMIHCGDPIHYSNISTSYWQQHFMCFGRLP